MSKSNQKTTKAIEVSLSTLPSTTSSTLPSITPSKTIRQGTRFVGVQSRESKIKKHNGRAGICFTIDYMDSTTKKRIRKDIGWTSDGITAAYASNVRADLIKKSQQVATDRAEYMPIAPITLGDAFDKYVNEWLLPRGKHARTDKSMFGHNLQEYAHIPLGDINVYMIDKMVATFSTQTLSVRSIRYLVGLIQRVMRKMEAWGLYNGQMPFSKVVLPKLNNARERFLTPAEAKELLIALKKRSLTVYTQAILSIHCGLRFGEIAALTMSDLDFYSNSIFIRDPKNGKSRHQVMTATISSELKTYLIENPRRELVFPSTTGGIQKAVSKTFEKTVKAMGLNTKNGVPITDARQKVVFHSLRHTYASWLSMSGQGQVMIADLLGHSSLEMSARYTHLFPDARRATATAIEDIFNHK